MSNDLQSTLKLSVWWVMNRSLQTVGPEAAKGGDVGSCLKTNKQTMIMTMLAQYFKGGVMKYAMTSLTPPT